MSNVCIIRFIGNENGISLRCSDRGRGGVDGYSHEREAISPKVLPFAQCPDSEGRAIKYPEDGVHVHRSQLDRECFPIHQITKVLWPSNSLDINVAEHAWPLIKASIKQEDSRQSYRGLCIRMDTTMGREVGRGYDKSIGSANCE